MNELRFGLYDLLEHRAGVTLRDLYRDRFELLRLAEEAGLWGYHTTEHHLNPVDATPSPNVFLAAAAQHTETIRLCTLVNVVPMYHPIRLAEELVMLDHLSNGRLEVGIGKGVSAIELQLMGHDPAEAHAQFDDDLAVVLDILTNGEVAGAPLPALPLQRPYPPLWYAGNAEYAGHRNLNVVLGGAAAKVAERAALHRRLIADRPHPDLRLNPGIDQPTIAASRHILVHPDGDAARSLARQAWGTYHDNIRAHFRRTKTAPTSNPTFDGDADAAMASGALVAGNPDDVAAVLGEFVRASGIDELLVSCCWGSIDQATAMASLRLYTAEVVPVLKASANGRTSLERT